MPPRRHEHFQKYARIRDEVWNAEGQLRGSYAPTVEALSWLSKRELARRCDRLERSARGLDLQFALPGEESNRGIWQLDPFPRVIETETWERLSAGIVQRAKAFNAYLSDLYGEQNILRERLVPVEVALLDPGFLRPFARLKPAGGYHCLYGAIDLICDAQGEWQVVENQLALPFGLSFVLQNRRMLAQGMPELFETRDIAPVGGFVTHLGELLRARSRRREPHVVMLTRAESPLQFFEDTFLARNMGISVAKPGDLLVRESRVYLRTIRGLERVDVVFRRIDSTTLDPVSTPNSGYFGIPGLSHCARLGNVAIVNSLGTVAADNRAALRYSDRIIGFYTNERALLKTATTYHLSDVDQRMYVLDHPEKFVLKPVQSFQRFRQRLSPDAFSNDPQKVLAAARAQPEFFVAQPKLQPTHLPRCRDGSFSSEPVFMRVFFTVGEEPVVLPGGLTRQGAGTEHSSDLLASAEGMKDTWIPSDALTRQLRVSSRLDQTPRANVAIVSRVAEALYWAGRYSERAENLARQMNLLEILRSDPLGGTTALSYWPLFRAVAAAAGRQKIAKRKEPPKNHLKLLRSLIIDRSEPGSIFSSLAMARRNLDNVRDFVTPEVWRVISEAVIFFQTEEKRRFSIAQVPELTDHAIGSIARLHGTTERTMLHDDGLQFFRIGCFMERAYGTAALSRHAFADMIEQFLDDQREDPDLTSLLRLTASLDAYRREYRSRALVHRVARLLVQSTNNPSSILFCLRNLHYCLSTLHADLDRRSNRVVTQRVESVTAFVEEFPIASIFPISHESGGAPPSRASLKPKLIEERFDQLRERLAGLHQLIEDTFFSHQNVFAREQMTIELE